MDRHTKLQELRNSLMRVIVLNLTFNVCLKHRPQKFDTYEDEIKYLISHENRNKFISNLSVDLKGNTLVLYTRVGTLAHLRSNK